MATNTLDYNQDINTVTIDSTNNTINVSKTVNTVNVDDTTNDITLNQTLNTVNIESSSKTIDISKIENSITIAQITSLKGDKGDTGATGGAGRGIPTGGSAGQILEKIDSTDYNTQWVDATGETNPSGSNTEIQFNNNGTFGSSPNFIFNSTDNQVLLKGNSSQAQNVFEFKNSTNSLLTSFNERGRLSIGNDSLPDANTIAKFTAGIYSPYSSSVDITIGGSRYGKSTQGGGIAFTSVWSGHGGGLYNDNNTNLILEHANKTQRLTLNTNGVQVTKLKITEAGSHLYPSLYLVDGNGKETGFYRGSFTDSASEKWYLITNRENNLTFTPESVGVFNTNPLATIDIQCKSASDKAVIIRGAASQTANLQEWQNSSGTVLGYVNSSGDGKFANKITLNDVSWQRYGGYMQTINSVVLGTSVVDSTYLLNLTTSLSTGGIACRAPSAGIKDFFIIRNYFNSNRNFAIDSDGRISANTTTAPSGALYEGHVMSASEKGIVIRGAASQTANLQEWQDNTGTTQSYVDSSGNFVMPNLPTSDPGVSGALWNDSGTLKVSI